MARQETAKTIINRAAVEVGLSSSTDPYSSQDAAFIQLTELLNVAGQELVELHPWQVLREEWEFTTDSGADTGIYTLPTDFSYMINQANWDQTNRFPIGGPLSAQGWSYLEGRDLATESIYVSMRLAENNLEIFPQPPPDALDLRFEYISRNWAKTSGGTGIDYTTDSGDVVKYEPILIQKFLKVKFLDAKGMNSAAARIEFENIFTSRIGKDEGAPILNAGGRYPGYPYLSIFNVNDTGFGT
jgi:hypothetical protein